MQRFIAIVTLVIISLPSCGPAAGSKGGTFIGTSATNGDANAGKRAFATNCAVCHGASGAGGVVGPSLRNERTRMDYGATVSWIKDPQPPMPDLYPQFLSEQQVRDVASYVQRL